MANSVRNDSSEFTGHAAGQTPIVLARLPRVGAALPALPASPATFQVVPPPEVMPQLDLRTEIDQRIKLHVADTPADQTSATSHFADRRHAVEHQPRVPQPEPIPSSRPATMRYDSLAKAQEKVGKPITFSEKVFQLHAQLAPHAGLIVALALIASAGLLYWMIVGPTQAPMPTSLENYSENFDPKLSDEGFSATANYVPDFTADVPQPATPENTNAQWTEVPLPIPSSVEEASQLALSTAVPVKLSELSSEDEPLYPTTDRSQDLDFTKLEPAAGDVPKPLPGIAGRPATSITTR